MRTGVDLNTLLLASLYCLRRKATRRLRFRVNCHITSIEESRQLMGLALLVAVN